MIEPTQSQVDSLKAALRKAIVNRTRAKKKLVEFDPAGSTYDIDWTNETKEWASLCDLDLDQIDPSYYC